MAQTPDRMLVSERAGQKALAREAAIRPIAFVEKLTGSERFFRVQAVGT
jgi:putative transposase